LGEFSNKNAQKDSGLLSEELDSPPKRKKRKEKGEGKRVGRGKKKSGKKKNKIGVKVGKRKTDIPTFGGDPYKCDMK